MAAVNPEDAIDLGTATTLIQENMPQTPQISRQSLKDIQLSSQAKNCVLESAQPSQISTTSTVRNQSSDRERFIDRIFFGRYLSYLFSNLQKAKVAFANMESRMSAMEKAMEADREETREETRRVQEVTRRVGEVTRQVREETR